MFLAKRNQNRPCQGGHIHDSLRFICMLQIGQHVGQYQSAFRIGINYLNGLPGQGSNHIARPLSIAIRHIFHQTNDADNIAFDLAAS